jgi:hypothetical protein
VHGYDGSEISVKGDGGPTCLTAPIWRDDGATDPAALADHVIR